MYRSKKYISKHGNEHIDLVLLAGTKDLSNRSVSPEDLICNLDKYISELKGFSNLGHIFLCRFQTELISMLLTLTFYVSTSYC